jgi:capsular polysaccharide transport system permease protein
LSDRPISEFWKERESAAAKEAAVKPAPPPVNQPDETPAEDSASFEPSDSIWDPEIKPGQGAKHKGLVTQLPQRDPQTQVPVKIERPGPILRQISQSPPLSDVTVLDALPQRSERTSWAGFFWFAICVLLPVAAAAYYYERVASPQYVTEFRFTVKDASAQGANAAAASNGLLAILGTTGGGNTNNYAVVDYLTSRAAVDQLQQRIDITHLYSKPSIDSLERYDSGKPMESFVKYWQGYVSANFDQVTGIATTQIRAFSPQDALLVANTMVKMSEELVNEIANRSQHDAVRFARAEVEKAEERLKQVRERLTEYRNRAGVIDPNTSVVASSATLVQTLEATLAQQEARLATMMREKLLPTAPTVVMLEHQIQSTKDQLANVERTIGKNANGAPLSKVMSEYEQIDMERQFSQTMLTGAMQALDQARASAAAQHLYITPYVRPSLPTAPSYPQPIMSILRIGALAFVFWLIALLIVRSMRERFA